MGTSNNIQEGAFAQALEPTIEWESLQAVHQIELPEIIEITVDYDLPVEEIANMRGITKRHPYIRWTNFIATRSGKLELPIKLIWIKFDSTNEETLEIIRGNLAIPADVYCLVELVPKLIELGVVCDNLRIYSLQKSFNVAGYNGYPVFYFGNGGKTRNLDLAYYEKVWRAPALSVSIPLRSFDGMT